MSMFGRTRSTDRTRVSLPAAEGLSTGFGENIGLAYEATRRVDSAYGFENRLAELYRENLSAMQQATGQQFEAPRSSIGVYAAKLRGELDDLPSAREGGSRRMPADALASDLESYATLDQTARELGLPTVEVLAEQVRREARELEAEFSHVNRRATFLGEVGAFTGGVGGSITTADPQNIITLGLGGFGAKAATRVITEMGIAAGVEGAATFTLSARNRELLGVDPLTFEQKIAQTAFAAVGAGVLRGAAEGAVPAVRATERIVAPSRVFARDLNAAADEIDLRTLAGLTDPETTARSAMAEIARLAPDQQMRADVLDDILARTTQTDTVRAARAMLADDVAIARLNPFGLSAEARRAHNAAVRAVTRDLADASGSMTSRPLPRPLVNGVEFSPIDLDAVDTPRVPAAAGRLRADIVNARAREDALRRDVERLKRRRDATANRAPDDTEVPELRAQVDALQERIDALRMRNATVPEDLLRQRDRARLLMEERQAQLRGQSGSNRERDAAATRRELRRQEQRLKQAEAATKAAERAGSAELADRLAADLAPKARFSANARAAILSRIRATNGAPKVTPSGNVLPLRPRGAELTASEAPVAARAAIRDAERAPEMERMANAAPERMRASIDDERGELDFGLDGPVNLDERIILDADTGASISLREMMDDFADDKALEKAMTECAI